jgi:hypothetical protein
VQRLDELRWADPLDVRVSEEELLRLVKKPQPREFVARRDRDLWAVLAQRAFRGAADGSAEKNRVLLALPVLALGNQHRVRARCAGLLAGGTAAAAVVAEALADEDRREGEGGDYDPLVRAVELARMGQGCAALRMAYQAGAEELLPDGAQAASGAGAGAAALRTPAEVVAAVLPSVRPEPDPEVMARVKALRPLPMREDALRKIKWAEALRKLEPGKAAGVDGWRNGQLISVMGCGREEARRFAEAVGAWAGMVFSGNLAAEVRPLFCAARVVLIPKPADGSQRPLGVVGVLRRLVARAAMRACAPCAVPWLLRRGQLGVGAAAGAEALAWRAQRAFERGEGVLVLDRRNAYPSVHPEPVLEAACALLPMLAGLLRTLLGVAALVIGYGVLQVFRGLFMGCPASPLLYAFAVELGVDAVRDALRRTGVDSSGFLDDGVLTAAVASVLGEAFRLVSEAGAVWGQSIHPGKSKLLVRAELLADYADVLPGVPRCSHMRLVGVPIGDDVWRAEECERVVSRATVSRRALAKRMPRVAAYYLLRKCDGLPALTHVLRGVPARLTARAARLHDKAVEEEMASMAATVPASLGPLRPATWLPLRLGGRAVASAVLVAGAAHAAATVQMCRLEKTIGLPDVAGAARDPAGAGYHHLGRESGRPPPGFTARASHCCGPARCRMEKESGCARGCCRVCCAVLGGCVGCTAGIAELRRTEDVRALLRDGGVRGAVQAAAEAAEVPVARVENALVAASVYEAPQRALTCALLGARFEALVRALTLDGKAAALRALRACAHPAAYAVWCAVPVALRSMSEAVFTVAMRQAYALPILDPRALHCQTAAGRESKICVLRDVRDVAVYAARNPEAADAHALTCKAGGGPIHTHDDVVTAFAQVTSSWGCDTRTDSKRFLPPNTRMDVDLPNAADYGTWSLMVDFTRKYGAGQVELERAERAKEAKYDRLYMAEVTMRGAGFNEFGELGPRAMDVVDRAVAQGVLHTGSHPDDLRAELLARLGAAVLFGNASALAHFAWLNPGLAGWAPSKEALRPRGQVLAVGVRGRLSAYTRGRGRPKKGVLAAAVGAAGSAVLLAGGGVQSAANDMRLGGVPRDDTTAVLGAGPPGGSS